MTSSMAQEDTNNWYSPDFDKELGDELVEAVQKSVGCFECGNPDPKLRCSRCKLAKYCNQECQKGDWKKAHKDLCSTYVMNREPQGSGSPGGAVPILVKSVGLISEPMFVKCMRHRRTVFLEAASKSKEPIPMGFSCSVVDMFDRLRVVAAPSFVDGNWKRHLVPHLLVEVVDDDQAIQTWHGRDLSNEAFEKVVDVWVLFYKELCDANIKVVSVTCGSGLVDRLDEFQAKLDSKGVSGLSLMPSIQF